MNRVIITWDWCMAVGSSHEIQTAVYQNFDRNPEETCIVNLVSVVLKLFII